MKVVYGDGLRLQEGSGDMHEEYHVDDPDGHLSQA